MGERQNPSQRRQPDVAIGVAGTQNLAVSRHRQMRPMDVAMILSSATHQAAKIVVQDSCRLKTEVPRVPCSRCCWFHRSDLAASCRSTRRGSSASVRWTIPRHFPHVAGELRMHVAGIRPG